MARLCAESGELKRALSHENIDSELFLKHVGEERKDLKTFLTLKNILDFLDKDKEENDWRARETYGWTNSLRRRLREQCTALIERPY